MASRYDRDLITLFTDPYFTRTESSLPSWPYRGLRRLQTRLGQQPLLADHARLRSMLELSAVRDPRLFHALFLHHCMTIGTALDQGACDEDIAALASGRWIGAALMTEAGRGNSSSSIRTEAVYDHTTHDFVLHTPGSEAVKYPPNVGLDGIPRLGVVSARLQVGGTDRGTALFLVALRDEVGPYPGVAITPLPPTALLPMDYAAVRFDHVRVPYRRWLSDGAGITADGSFHDPLDGPDARSRRSLSMSRFACGAVTAGLAAVARSSVTIALTHARRRPTLDRLAGEIPAIDHLNQQRLLFGAAAAALAATVVARRTTARCWHIPTPDGRHTGPSPAAMRESALSKVSADMLADAAVTRARSACGALGFFSENKLIGYQALTMAFHTAGGDNRLILLDAAWAMATGPDYLPPEDQFAPDNWTRLFGTRERLLHAELVAGLRGADGHRAIAFDTWNRHTELAQRLAEAHAARTTAEILHDEWHGPTVADTRRLLLGDLYQLHCLEQTSAHTGWYLAHGLLTAAQVLALPEHTGEICMRLAHHTDTLIELLDIPEELLTGLSPDYSQAPQRSSQ